MKMRIAPYKIEIGGETVITMMPGAQVISLGKCSWNSLMMYAWQCCEPVSPGELVTRKFLAVRTNVEFERGDNRLSFIGTVNPDDGGPLVHVFELIGG